MAAMGEERGWEPLAPPRGRAAAAFEASPFTRLARAHALGMAGDTLITLALANSLFFNIEPDAARWRIALYLLLTMAPFAVVSPLIGPAIDRAKGGRRLMVIGSAALRAGVSLLMIGHIDTLLLFPEAFVVLVLSKGYHVAKNALVPTTVSSDAELVEANSKLSLLSGVVGFVAALPGLAVLVLLGSEWVLGLAALVFVGATVLSFQLPRTAVAPKPEGEAERTELRAASILLAATATMLLRGIVGFLTFLIAFSFRNLEAPTWWFGVAVAASGIGTLLGALVAPRMRRVTREELILIGGLVGALGTGLIMAVGSGSNLVAASATALSVGLAAAAGKLAFDAIVQRDAPDANRGRAFARFETRFQLAWVVGAFLPVVIPIPAQVGYLIIAAVAGFAAVTYLLNLRQIRHLSPQQADDLLAERRRVRRERSRLVVGRALGRLRRVGPRSRSSSPTAPAPADETMEVVPVDLEPSGDTAPTGAPPSDPPPQFAGPPPEASAPHGPSAADDAPHYAGPPPDPEGGQAVTERLRPPDPGHGREP